MKGIIFRGKSIDTGEWVYGDVYATSETPMIIRNGIASEWDNFIAVDKDTIGQYVGLNDIKDNKIFRGDICKFIINHGYIEEISSGQIFYEDCGWSITNKATSLENSMCSIGLGSFVNGWSGEKSPPSVIEVIGNVWDNPELLEVN